MFISSPLWTYWASFSDSAIVQLVLGLGGVLLHAIGVVLLPLVFSAYLLKKLSADFEQRVGPNRMHPKIMVVFREWLGDWVRWPVSIFVRQPETWLLVLRLVIVFCLFMLIPSSRSGAVINAEHSLFLVILLLLTNDLIRLATAVTRHGFGHVVVFQLGQRLAASSISKVGIYIYLYISYLNDRIIGFIDGSVWPTWRQYFLLPIVCWVVFRQLFQEVSDVDLDNGLMGDNVFYYQLEQKLTHVSLWLYFIVIVVGVSPLNNLPLLLSEDSFGRSIEVIQDLLIIIQAVSLYIVLYIYRHILPRMNTKQRLRVSYGSNLSLLITIIFAAVALKFI